MTDDLILLRLLVVSVSPSERDTWRRGALLAALPIEIMEAATCSEAGDVLKRVGADILLVDSGLAGAAECITAAHALTPAPLVLSILPATIGQAGDIDIAGGFVTRAASAEQAREFVDRCIKTRMTTRVMIVDDSNTTRAIVRKILRVSQFKLDISEATEGTVALNTIRSGVVDFVLLDHNMPGLNGIETLSEIKRETPHVAVVMMTSTIDQAVVERAHKAGAAGFLKKPFFPKDVDELLVRHYGLQAPAGA